MRNFILMLFMALGFSLPVLAQNDHRDEGDHQKQRDEGNQHQGGQRQGGQREGRQHEGGGQRQQPQGEYKPQQGNVQQRYLQNNAERHARPQNAEENRGGFENWRRDNRYNWQAYRQYHPNYYRVPYYYAPHGYGYQRFSIGFFLPGVFFAPSYWVRDPWYYRLPPAYPGTRWIRYYRDVVLIDIRTGAALDVVYDFFW